MKLLSVCFFKGGFFPSTFYKSATFEEGKDSSGLALGFSTMQYSNETLLDGSSIEKSRFWLSWKFFVKHGISENFGLSLKTNLASVITDAKYQYFDGEVLDMAFDLGIKASSFPQIKDNEIVYDTFYSIYPAALFTFKLSDKFGTSLGMEHKKIYNINPEGEESSASFKGGSVNSSAGEEFNFIFQPSLFYGKDF